MSRRWPPGATPWGAREKDGAQRVVEPLPYRWWSEKMRRVGSESWFGATGHPSLPTSLPQVLLRNRALIVLLHNRALIVPLHNKALIVPLRHRALIVP